MNWKGDACGIFGKRGRDVAWRRIKCESRVADVQEEEGTSVCRRGGILMARLAASSLRAGTCKRNPPRCIPVVGHDGARL